MPEWLLTVPRQSEPSHDEVPRPIEVPVDIPMVTLLKVVGNEGTITLSSGRVLVTPSDENAARWIVYTLYALGYTCTYP